MLNKKVLVSALFLIMPILYANKLDNGLKKVEHSLSFKFVNVSKTDVNRVICANGNIGKVIYSKDKEISIEKDKENAFIKLLPVVTRANEAVVESVVNEFNRDIYIECNKKIYSLNLTPKNITAQTILLYDDSLTNENIQAKKFEQSNSFEKMVSNIIKSVYKDKEPDGYITKRLKSKTIKFNELELLPTKTYLGNEYIVYEYKITAKTDIELDEKMFVNFVANNPLALSLTDLNLSKGDKARLFVIANNTPDPITIEQKTKKYLKSLKELEAKDKKDTEATKSLEKKDIKIKEKVLK